MNPPLLFSVQRVKGRAAVTDTASHQLLAAPGVGFINWITAITVSNTSATDTEVQIKTGSTTIWTMPAPSHGGSILMFPDPISGNDNDPINLTVNDSATTVTVSVAGHISPDYANPTA